MSRVEPARVAEKAAYVRGEVAFLRTLPADLDAGADPAAIRAARYSLHTAISALTDIAYHLCAKRLQYAPQNARDAFRRLSEAGALANEQMATISSMIGFRNLAVHGYEAFDDNKLREVLRGQLDDLEAVLVALERYAAAATS